MHLQAYFDGASRGNPGPASGGGVLVLYCLDDDDRVADELVLWEGGRYLGVQTSYKAEVEGARLVLEVSLQLCIHVLNQSAEGTIWNAGA